MKIKVGDVFVCIKKVHRKNEKCFYFKGKMYQSEINNCITDEEKNKSHTWTKKKLKKKYWLKLK